MKRAVLTKWLQQYQTEFLAIPANNFDLRTHMGSLGKLASYGMEYSCQFHTCLFVCVLHKKKYICFPLAMYKLRLHWFIDEIAEGFAKFGNRKISNILDCQKKDISLTAIMSIHNMDKCGPQIDQFPDVINSFPYLPIALQQFSLQYGRLGFFCKTTFPILMNFSCFLD